MAHLEPHNSSEEHCNLEFGSRYLSTHRLKYLPSSVSSSSVLLLSNQSMWSIVEYDSIATGTIRLDRKAKVEELPTPKFFLIRHFPDIEAPDKPSIYELVESRVKNLRFGEVWGGETTLTFNKSELEEITKLKPVKILGGYSFSIGFTIEGGKVLHRYV